MKTVRLDDCTIKLDDFYRGRDTSGKADSSRRAPIWPLAAFLMLPNRTTEWTFNSCIAVSHFDDFALRRLHLSFVYVIEAVSFQKSNHYVLM